MKIAAIDVGSNSIHMVIVRRHPDGRLETIDREKEMVRLASGGLERRGEDRPRLTPDRFEAGLAAIGKFVKLAERHGVDALVCTATSAVREAENGGDFVREARARHGVDIRVLPSQEEARLIYLAAREAIDLGGRRALFIDIGGGSIELTVGDARKAQFMESLKLGVIRLSERFLRNDPPAAREVAALAAFVETEVASPIATARRLGFQTVVGTSGTILAIAATLAQRRGKQTSALDPFGVDELEALAAELCAKPERDRAKIAGIGTRRAPTIAAGTVLLSRILKLAGARTVVPCDRALREGLVIDYLEKNSARLAELEEHRSPRERSVHELARRSGYDHDHARHVARLARDLFDQLRPVHGLGARDRELLEHAATLHDVGQSITFPRHHRHSYYLIRNGDLRGFDAEEVMILALVAKHHRGRGPSKKDDDFAALSKRARRSVVGLSALVRIADGLDRSHFQVAERVAATVAGKEVRIRVTAHGDAELEVWAALRKADVFEQAFGKRVRIELETRPAREKLARAAKESGRMAPAPPAAART